MKSINKILWCLVSFGLISAYADVSNLDKALIGCESNDSYLGPKEISKLRACLTNEKKFKAYFINSFLHEKEINYLKEECSIFENLKCEDDLKSEIYNHFKEVVVKDEDDKDIKIDLTKLILKEDFKANVLIPVIKNKSKEDYSSVDITVLTGSCNVGISKIFRKLYSVGKKNPDIKLPPFKIGPIESSGLSKLNPVMTYDGKTVTFLPIEEPHIAQQFVIKEKNKVYKYVYRDREEGPKDMFFLDRGNGLEFFIGNPPPPNCHLYVDGPQITNKEIKDLSQKESANFYLNTLIESFASIRKAGEGGLRMKDIYFMDCVEKLKRHFKNASKKPALDYLDATLRALGMETSDDNGDENKGGKSGVSGQ